MNSEGIKASSDEGGKEKKQFQATYYTLQQLKPELFASDYAAKFIKVEGYVEDLGGDMEAFTNLHKDLDTLGLNQTSIVGGGN